MIDHCPLATAPWRVTNLLTEIKCYERKMGGFKESAAEYNSVENSELKTS